MEYKWRPLESYCTLHFYLMLSKEDLFVGARVWVKPLEKIQSNFRGIFFFFEIYVCAVIFCEIFTFNEKVWTNSKCFKLKFKGKKPPEIAIRREPTYSATHW